MKTKIVVHEAEEGGFWAEVPAIPGCATQGDSMDELMQNLQEAIEGCLSIEVAPRTGWYRTDAGTACMKSLSGRDFARIINRAARLGLASRQWQPPYSYIYGKSGSVVRLSIPIHGNKPLKTGLLRHLAKLAELSDEDL